ncbi:MAG TPA: hypothetical protein ENK83_05735 [Aliiroseovarius sp.]|nr:hypothetical protein [Aliiroseovarius sp.]
MLWMVWWFWAATALALAILEMLAPGFIFLGFAIGALGLAALLGLGLVVGLAWLLVIGAVFSLAAWLALRAIFGVPGNQVRTYSRDEDIND